MVVVVNDNVIHGYVHRLIHAVDQDDIEEEADRLKFEAAGHRLVGGGSDGDGVSRFTDFRTHELLAEIPDAEYARFEWPSDWVHVDSLATFEFRTNGVAQGGLPPSLAEVLLEWVLDHLDDARHWVQPPSDG